MNSRSLISIPWLLAFLLLGVIVSGFWISRAGAQEGSEAKPSTETKGDSDGDAFSNRLTAMVGATIETVGKAGQIKNGTILIRGSKIQAVGSDIEIPVNAWVIDVTGKTILPGIVDPYFVVTAARSTVAPESRTVTFGGRTFTIGGGAAPESTAFLRLADGFDVRTGPWSIAIRSGITTPHLVTSGFGQSIIAKTIPDHEELILDQLDGTLFVAASTRTDSMNLLRSGLEEKSSSGNASGGDARARLAAMRGGRGGGRGGSDTTTSGAASPASSDGQSEKKLSLSQQLWNDVKAGKKTLFVNANSAAAIVHVLKIVDQAKKAKVVLIADGADLFQAREAIKNSSVMVVLRPRLETVPNSATRLNMAKELQNQKTNFSFSLSLNQADYSQSQDTPLFPVSALVHTGLSRTAALESLTINPAKLLGMEKTIGSIEVDKQANLVIFDTDPLESVGRVQQVYVDGRPVYENQ